MKTSLRNKLLFFIIFSLLWQLVSMIVRKPVMLPSPFEVMQSLWKIIRSGELLSASAATLARGFTGAAVSFLIGLAAGAAMGFSRRIDVLLSTPVLLLQSVPVISWILLALIWTDNRWVPFLIIILSTVSVFTVNVREGVRRTDPKLLEMARVFHVGRGKTLREIMLPSVSGYLVSSLKIALGLTYRTAVMAEVLAHPGSGIGEKMGWARTNVDTAGIVAWTLVIIFFAVLTDGLLGKGLKTLKAEKP